MSSYKRNNSSSYNIAILNAWAIYCEYLSSFETPEGCLVIATKEFMDHALGHYCVLLMKKVNMHGAEASIKVPYGTRLWAIGRKGKNAKKIAKLINASHVIIVE